MTIDFTIKESNLKDLYYFIPSVSLDTRGDIWTSYLKEILDQYIPSNLEFKHDKFSSSKKNVLRGIHGDNKSWKLVTCVHGEIFGAVVDLRKDSATFNSSETFYINNKEKKMVLIPPNFGNAYFVVSDYAVYHYKLAYEGDYIDADKQFSYAWNNPQFDINWPCDNPILSERDAKNEKI